MDTYSNSNPGTAATKTLLDTGSYNPNPDRLVTSSLSAPAGTPISASTLSTPTQPYQTPPPPTDPTQQYAATIGSIDTIINQANQPTATDQAQNTTKSYLQQLYDSLLGKGASIDSTGNIDATGAVATAKDKAAQALGYQNYNDPLNQLTQVNGQIQALQKEALAIPLQLEQQAKTTGTISQGALQGQTTEQLRQNTIRALGLASIAQTLQGNIARAEDSANKAVEAEFLPFQNQLNYLQATYNLNKDQLDREDKARSVKIQAQLAERQRLLSQAQDDKKAILALANAALSNFPKDPAVARAAQQAIQTGDLATAYSLVGQYQKDPAAVQKAIDEHNLAIAQTNLAYANAAKLYADAKANGTSTQVAQQRSGAVNLINTLIDDKNIGRAAGNLFGGLTLPGTPVQTTFNNLKQLKGILALENRAQLKGSGAISDFESRTLDRAATSLGINDNGTSNLSPAQLTIQLKQVRGALTTLSGQPAYIVVDGDPSKTYQATSDQITKIVNDGHTVQYQ